VIHGDIGVTSVSPKTVLVVDDDRDIREILTDALGTEGYRVFTAADGLDALAWLAEAQRSGAHLPDVILLDLLMPRMDGVAFRARLSEDPTLDAIPVVVLSGNSAAVSAGAAPNFAGALRKPISLEALLAVVHTHTASS
jgi:two-component system response regulator MprA